MDYLSLITSEHQGQPKFTAWLNAAIGMVQDAQKFAASLYSLYDLDMAVGAQLDKIGEILGMPRRLPFTPTGAGELSAYQFDSLNLSAQELDDKGITAQKFDSELGTILNVSSSLLDDSTYRLALRAVIAEAHFDGTVGNLYSLFHTVLANTGLLFDITDNQNMSMSVIVYGVTTSLIKDLLENGYIVPRPEGVHISINVTSNKVFAWGLNNDMYAGWGTGHWLIRR